MQSTNFEIGKGPMTSYKSLLVKETGENNCALTITMTRPEDRNALTPSLIHELITALDQAACSSYRSIILTGAAPAFCSGMDLRQLEKMAALSANDNRLDSRSFAYLLRRLYQFPKPTIAAVNGAAIAGGLGLVSACDFVLAVPEAKFGYTEARIGFVPAIVAPFLVRQVGDKRARDLLLTARIFSAEEALSYGLLTRIVAASDLQAEALNLAQQLFQNSPQSLSAIKMQMRMQGGAALEAELEVAIEANARQRQSPDFKEGLRAFLEKRPPVWSSPGKPDGC